MTNTSKSQIITLAEIQSKLNVPKKHWNKYGEFYYRNIDDILKAVKPVLKELGFYLILTDDIVQVGNYNYIKAVATASNGAETYSASGMAREIIEKKKMDSSQLTGVASAYARKTALCGLFGLDDNQDADSDKIPLQEEGPPLKKKQYAANPETSSQKPTAAVNKELPTPFKQRFSAGTPGQIEMLFDMLVLLTDKDMEEAEAEYNSRGRNRSVISDLITKYQKKVDELKASRPADIAYKKDLLKLLANPLITEDERTEMIYGINKMTFDRVCQAVDKLEQTIAERKATQLQTA